LVQAHHGVTQEVNEQTRDILRAAKIIGVEPESLEYEQARRILQQYMVENANLKIRKAITQTRKSD
jgi:hypothetical protein